MTSVSSRLASPAVVEFPRHPPPQLGRGGPRISGYRPRPLTTQVGEQALDAVIMETYISGVSTCKVDALMEALLARPLECSSYAYVYLDSTDLKGRQGKAQQVCSRAVVVAMGVNADGRREVLGIKVGESESEVFWAEFISHVKGRGLDGVKLVSRLRS